MACGTPVIASNASSIPEVVGDAALSIYPTDAGDLASAISRIAAHSDLRADLSRRGLERAARFTWDRVARAVLAAYARAFDGGTAPITPLRGGAS